MTTDIFCFYLHNRLIQTSQTGRQQYSDTSLFSIPWYNYSEVHSMIIENLKTECRSIGKAGETVQLHWPSVSCKTVVVAQW